MSTVPGFPSGSPVTATDILWITQGTGVDRDKKATVAQIGDAGHKALALGDASAVASTDKLFLVQGAGASKDKMGTVTMVVGAGMASATDAYTETTDLAGTEFIPVRETDGTMKKGSVATVGMRAAHTFALTDVSLSQFGAAGADVLLSAASATASVTVAHDKLLGAWELSLDIFVPPTADTGHYPVAVKIPVSAFPASLLGSIASVAFPSAVGLFKGNLLSSLNMWAIGADATTFTVAAKLADGSAIHWDSVANTSGNITLTVAAKAFV